ncbi:unnamed protein product [Miscanthus lutarioriparius]|uniref:Uncharacterized protein n=1 Tax=Miscanthus lutarioriparius TaxID=422564 RepID=A0A811P2J7_9POAL|nr:unnamed protein product [Miscanthus lutarioriparius]
MISALLRCGHRRLCKSTPPRSAFHLPLLAGVEAELHPVSVGHMSMAAEMEQPLRESMSMDIEEGPRIGNGSIVDNPASDLVKSESDRIKTFYQTVLSAIMVFVTAALSSYKDMKTLYSTTSRNRARLSSLLVDEGLFIFMTFLCAVVLMMSEFFVYQYGRRGRVWCWVLTILVAVTGVMLIVADTILLIVANRSNMLLSVLLGPVVLLVGVVAGAGAWMREEPSSELGSRYDTAMKVTFDMATVGTIVSFTLQGGIVFGYLKTRGSKQVKRDPPLDLAACYATSTLSLIAMMVFAMPLARLPDDMLKGPRQSRREALECCAGHSCDDGAGRLGGVPGRLRRALLPGCRRNCPVLRGEAVLGMPTARGELTAGLHLPEPPRGSL